MYKIYKRLKKGILLNMELKPISLLDIESEFESMIDNEDYELCHELKELSNKYKNLIKK